MGYMRHHAIIVTSYNKEKIEKAHKKASTIFQTSITPITTEATNGYTSFLIAPDGSKEGWDDSNKGDEARRLFIKWIRMNSSSLDYVEVQFADDNGVNYIINCS